MERRNFLLTTAGALATLSVANHAFADDNTKLETLSLTNEIAHNHGHFFELSLESLVLLIREANTSGDEKATIDIQGQSGHPHTLSLSVAEIVTIMVDGVLEKDSSIDANHSHKIFINLE